MWGDAYDGYLDYVAGWFIKASQYFQSVPRGGRFAFVSTNSIAQGAPVSALFRRFLDGGWRIRFAHQTSAAPGAAAVHRVITGFDRRAPHEKARPMLFTYLSPKAQPEAVPVDHIKPLPVRGTRRLRCSPQEPSLRIFQKFASGQSLRTAAISSSRRRTIHKSRPTRSP